MATAGQAETPTNNTKLNNCDNREGNNSGGSSQKLVNGSSSDPDFNSPENNNAMKEGYRYNHHVPGPYDHHRINQNSHGHPSEQKGGGMEGQGGQQEYPPPPPHQQQQQHLQYQQQQQYPPYNVRGQGGYEQQPPPQPLPPHHNNGPESYQQQQQHQQHPGYPPPMRYPGKPMPGGGSGSNVPPQPPHGYPPGPGGGGMRPNYPGGMGAPGQSISQQPSGQTPTLNQLLQSPGGANAGASGGGGGGQGAPGGGHRYPPPPPPTGYEHGGYPPQNPPNHAKADYSQQGPTGWPPASRPPPNSYAHPPPPPFQQPQQQPMYRQNAPGGGSRGGPPQPTPGQPGQPPQQQQQPPQHQSYYQHHQQQGHHPGYPPPPPQSPHYPPPPHTQRYPSPGPGMRPPDNQPHYPPQHPPGMAPDAGNGGSDSTKSTPPPPPSPSLANHGQNPPSPQQSPRSTPHPPPVSSNNANSLPPPNSPSHRPQGSSPSNSYPPPPDVGEVTGCNSNDSVGGPNPNQGPGPRPSPSPTGSAGSRSMSPAVGNQNIPMPPRPSSSQSDGTNAPRMSQSPMPGQGGSYPGQGQSMAPPPHHMGYQSGGKHGHQPPSGGMIPPPSPQGHYPHQPQPTSGQGHWQHPQQQQQQVGPSPGGYGAVRPGPPPQQHGGHGGMMSPYPPPAQQPMQANNYGGHPRHPMPNHVGGPPPPSQGQGQGGPHQGPGGSQYNSPYPPHYPPQQQQQPWSGVGGPGSGPPPGTPPPPRSQLHLKQQLQHKLGYPSPHGYPMGPPGPGMPSGSSGPSQTPPPHSHHPSMMPGGGEPQDGGGISNPPNLVSVGPDGANVDEVSQQSTLSNASGTSGGGDDGPPMPKLRPEGGRHQNYQSHPTTPQNNAVPSPGAASMNSAHEEYGEMNSPGWPRTPASPGLNSHPPPPSEHFKGKNKKADSLNKLYDMDDNPERRMFLDKLIHYMEENNSPIASCPTISKNPLDLFRLYLFVKERGGFLEVSKNKTWKDIAGSLGIGASSSAAYTLRKHYTKHLFPFECKFDRGGIDPGPLINQVETSTKKKGKTAAPVPSPGSSNSQDSFPGPNNNTNSSSMDGFNTQQASSSYPTYGQPPSGGEYGGNSGPTPSPLARPPGPPPQNSQQPSQHPGVKSQINVSNPFDDDQYSQHYPQQTRPNYCPPYSSQPPSAGYPGGPSGSYPPYPNSGEQQYPGRPPVPPMDGYSGGAGPGSYGRPMYPPSPYGDGSSPPGGYPGQPHHQSGSSQGPPHPTNSQQNSTPGADDRYGMPPPPTVGAGQPPPQQGGYPRGPYPPSAAGPPSSSGGVQVPPGGPHPPPPNGYPSQDYYNSQSQTEQGYPSGGKHMPPPHPGMRYPPGKEGAQQPQYPGGYPSPAQQGPQQRVQPYESQPGPRLGFTPPPSRSSPSPSPNVQTPSAPPTPQPAQNKPSWNTPEGWPNSGSHYPGQQRGYPVPPQGSSTHTPPQGSTPAPAQSPGSTPPQQAISPTPWGASSPSGGVPPGRSSSGPLPPPNSNAQQGPPPPPPGATWPQQDPRYASASGGNITPGSGPSSSHSHSQSQQPPWTPPGAGPPQGQSRSGGGSRSQFPPGGKPTGPSEMFRGYGPSPSSLPPPSGPVKGPHHSAHMGPPGGMSPQQVQGPHPGGFPHASPSGQVKREIIFPPESVEAVTPVLSRRRKMHKSDVSPVEAWRIMMSLKSGLLAEVTWALDVLNVLLYDDQSVSYFSLTYLPGLLDILLEHLRRALILLFGQSIGIDLSAGDKLEDAIKPAKHLEWYEREDKVMEDEPDLGTPIKAFPRDAHRTLLLQSSTNYTMISRFNKRKVRILSRDDEPFIVSGPREWDFDEKWRNDPDQEQLTGTMDVSKHIVTYFNTSLPIPLPIVRDLKAEERRSKQESDSQKLTASETSIPMPENTLVPMTEGSVGLELYRCETKMPTIVTIVAPTPTLPSTESSSPSITVTNTTNPVTPINTTANSKKPVTENGPIVLNSIDKVEEKVADISEKKNCQLFPTPPTSSVLLQNSKLNSIVQKKAKRLDDVLGRLGIRKEQTENDNAVSEPPQIIPAVVEPEPIVKKEPIIKEELSPVVEDPTPPPSQPVVENGLSDTLNSALLMGGSSDNSNLSDAANSENTCDSNSKHFKNVEIKMGDIFVRDPGATLKRKRMEDYEDECYTRDESSLYLVTESQDSLVRRCLSICNIIRNLTFVPGNELEFGKCTPFLSLMGKLILLHHDHPVKKAKSTSASSSTTKKSSTSKPKLHKVSKTDEETGEKIKPKDEPEDEKSSTDDKESPESNTAEGNSDEASKSNAAKEDDSESMEVDDRAVDSVEKAVKEKSVVEDEEEEEEEEEDALFAEEPPVSSDLASAVVEIEADSCTSLTNDSEWWWDYVHHIREHVLVMIANISGQMDLSQFSEEVSRPILDGLLHWAICPAAYGQDPFPTLSPGAYLSPQRLAIEALVKLSVIQGNVDLLLATPPFSRIEKLCQLLCRSLVRTEEQVMREFALNLLYYLSAADSGVARTIAVQNPCISLLISFIEQAEHNAMNIANSHGFSVLRENPEAMGTSLDMLRRAAMTLLNLARHSDNRPLFVQHEPRLLQLVMSQILEQKVAAMVAQVLYQCSTPDSNSSQCSQQKYLYASNMDTFYTPLFSRSRNPHPPQSHVG